MDLRAYVRHIGNCGAADSTNPLDERCICGLRQVWVGQERETDPELCRCGRSAFYSFNAPDPRCPGCEYMAAETCDCVPI